MDGEPRADNRRPLICGMVAAAAMCVVWLLPSAQPDGQNDTDRGTVLPGVEQLGGDLDQDR